MSDFLEKNYLENIWDHCSYCCTYCLGNLFSALHLLTFWSS